MGATFWSSISGDLSCHFNPFPLGRGLHHHDEVAGCWCTVETSHLPLLYEPPSPRSLFGETSICCELSHLHCHGHSLLLSSYLHKISRKENSACSACGHPLQDLNHLLDCPASEPLRKSIFGSSLSILDLWSRPWGVARLLGLHGVPLCPHPLERVG